MPFRPNYNQQRNDRARAKEAKKQEKLRRREEESERRKAGGAEHDADSEANPEAGNGTEPGNG